MPVASNPSALAFLGVLNLRKVQTKVHQFFQENALFLLKKHEIAAFVLVDKSGYFDGCGERIRTNDLRVMASPRLAVPEKPFGLTLFLRFFDRCG